MEIPLWTVELHSHTIYSKDSLTRLNSLPEICRARGIDKLAITDHDTARGALEAASMYPMLIIPGEEIMTTEGEILAWFIQEEVRPGLTPQEAIAILREQGAFIGVPHPFDRYRKGAWQPDALMDIVELVDSIEVFNSRCIHNEDNLKALAFAEEHGKLMTCGSDAHIRAEYGRAVMRLEPFHSSGGGLRQAVAAGTRDERLSSFFVHFGTKYAKWAKKLRPSLKPGRG
jgi:hypothetical protein